MNARTQTHTIKKMCIRRLKQRTVVEQLHSTLLPLEVGAQRSHQKGWYLTENKLCNVFEKLMAKVETFQPMSTHQ